MSSLSYLLSSAEGFPLSKHSLNTKPQDTNWRSIARLIAFIASIFPKREAIQFSDGNRTYFSQPQETANGVSYFVTLFIGDGDSMDLSSLCRYIGYVTTTLFQVSLEECFRHLKERMSDLVLTSTCQDTLQEDIVSDSGDAGNQDMLFLGSSLNVLECLNVFEEHFIPELLLKGQTFCQHWFCPILDYCDNVVAASEKCLIEMCSVFIVLADDVLSQLFSSVDMQHQSRLVEKDLESVLLEYHSIIRPTNNYQEKDQDREMCVNSTFDFVLTADNSHLLRISEAKYSSVIGDDEGFYLAVSKFPQEDRSLLFVCHIPTAITMKKRSLDKECEIFYVRNEDGNESMDHEVAIYPLQILQQEFCMAWNDCLHHLQRSLFLSYGCDDTLQSPSFYHNILLPPEQHLPPDINLDVNMVTQNIFGSTLNNNEQAEQTEMILPSWNISEGNHNDVEYIPHPPDVSSQSSEHAYSHIDKISTFNVGTLGQDPNPKISKKVIIRPGRVYV